MSDTQEIQADEKFGTSLGLAPGGVPVYSCDYDSADDEQLPDRHAYRSYYDGIYMGHKWQCVEFARRWLYINKGYIFNDIAMAFDIFELKSVRVIEDNSELPLRSFRNGSKRHPEPGCMLIWDEGGEFVNTGHVAVVTEVSSNWVRLVEQNVSFVSWQPDQNYSREIKAVVTDTGEYWLECTYGDATILGWVIQTDDDTYATHTQTLDRGLFNLQIDELADNGQATQSWLNVANADEAAYVVDMKAHKLSSNLADQYKFASMSNTAFEELRDATMELHALFMHATDYVLRDDSLLEKFNIPRVIWPKIHQSWNNRHNQMITGRFDFAMSEKGLKVYEYNCDSASCHMETGTVQGRWAAHFGCHSGRDAGASLIGALKRAWASRRVDHAVHILHDADTEESYHALFMQQTMKAADIKTKIIHGFSDLSRDQDGNILDGDGLQVRSVWKTWAWETALDQIRSDYETGEEGKNGNGSCLRLADVLLNKDVMVYEPLWTLIPSNKAILPILWQLFPSHQYLLNSSYELSDELRASGYVDKPIVGRGGSNIRIIDANERLLEATQGQFEERDRIFQELFALPEIDQRFVQVSSFTASGEFAGGCIRMSGNLVVDGRSDLIALRIVDDEEILN